VKCGYMVGIAQSVKQRARLEFFLLLFPYVLLTYALWFLLCISIFFGVLFIFM
jgi:hypothetical protein